MDNFELEEFNAFKVINNSLKFKNYLILSKPQLNEQNCIHYFLFTKSFRYSKNIINIVKLLKVFPFYTFYIIFVLAYKRFAETRLNGSNFLDVFPRNLHIS